MDCGGIPELAYSEFSKWIREKTAGKRVPLSGSIELTHRCNLRCVHCYLDGHHTPPPDQQELTTDEIFDIIDQIVAEGCLWLLLTGGEPLLREDWKEIYLYAKRKGLLVTLFTNGTLITEEDAAFLAKWRPRLVEVSLYGATEATYESITGIPGSYESCVKGIELLRTYGIPLRLKSVLMTKNRDELDDLHELADDMGVRFRYDPILLARADGDLAPYQLRLTPEDVVAIDASYDYRVEMWRNEYADRYGRDTGNPQVFVCDAGIRGFHIDPFGKLSLCLTYRQPEYDLRQGTFVEAWQNDLLEARKAQFPRDHACVNCKLRRLCPRCPAITYNEGDVVDVAGDYLCEVTHRRFEVLHDSAS